MFSWNTKAERMTKWLEKNDENDANNYDKCILYTGSFNQLKYLSRYQ